MILLIALLLLSFQLASAVCPLCTVGVAVGIGFSRYLGIDDIITGLWIGSLIISLSLWLIEFLDKKKIVFFARNQIIITFFYVATILPLYFSGFIGQPYNAIIGIDKLLLGMFLGTIIFIASIFADKYLRKINNNKVLFAYQKALIPLAFLLIASIIIYLLLGIFS